MKSLSLLWLMPAMLLLVIIFADSPASVLAGGPPAGFPDSYEGTFTFESDRHVESGGLGGTTDTLEELNGSVLLTFSHMDGSDAVYRLTSGTFHYTRVFDGTGGINDGCHGIVDAQIALQAGELELRITGNQYRLVPSSAGVTHQAVQHRTGCADPFYNGDSSVQIDSRRVLNLGCALSDTLIIPPPVSGAKSFPIGDKKHLANSCHAQQHHEPVPGYNVRFDEAVDSSHDLREATGLLLEVTAPAEPLMTNQGFRVTLKVTNKTGSELTGVAPVADLPHTGGAEKVGGPHPSSVSSLQPGQTAEFIYGYRAIAEGDITFGGQATATKDGIDIEGSVPLTCQLTASISPAAAAQAACRNLFPVYGQALHLIRFYEHPMHYPEQGHAWVEMVPHTGLQAGQSLFFGKYPDGNNFFDTAPLIKDDKNAPWEFRISYAVTTDDYNAAVNYINDQLRLRQNYRLLSSNCQDFAANVATAARIKLPGYKTFLIVSDPTEFHNQLDIYYTAYGRVYEGGIIEKNPALSTQGGAGGGGNFQTRCSYRGIADQALAGQATLAQGLGLEFHKQTLPSLSTNVGAPCSVSLSNISADSAIMLFDFGDGSDVVQLETSATHTYLQEGTYNARVITVDRGAVREWVFSVSVGTGPGSCSHAITVPPPPPSGWTPGPYPPDSVALSAAVDFYPWGDIDCSGDFSVGDVALLLQSLAAVPVEIPCADPDAGGPAGWLDLDCSGEATARDALYGIKFVGGLVTNPPAQCPGLGTNPS